MKIICKIRISIVKKLQHSSAPGFRKAPLEQVTDHYNESYFNRWSDLWNNSGFTGYYGFIAIKYEPKFMNYGYSLTKGFDINEERLREGERISATAGALYRLLADAYALMVRLTTRSKGYIRKQLRTHLPGSLWPERRHRICTS